MQGQRLQDADQCANWFQKSTQQWWQFSFTQSSHNHWGECPINCLPATCGNIVYPVVAKIDNNPTTATTTTRTRSTTTTTVGELVLNILTALQSFCFAIKFNVYFEYFHCCVVVLFVVVVAVVVLAFVAYSAAEQLAKFFWFLGGNGSHTHTLRMSNIWHERLEMKFVGLLN